MFGRRGGGQFMNLVHLIHMWRASLEILDFLPLTTVDYSGGMIISDWYTDNNQRSLLKLQFVFIK